MVKSFKTNILTWLKTKTYIKTEIDNFLNGKSDTNHTHTNASTTTPGFLSAEDKTKLNNLKQITVDSTINATSTNPVQNRVINTALTGKANTNHTHSITNITNLQSQLDGKANSVHTHDDRYYTETEMNTKLNGKANSSHTHSIGDVTNLQSKLDTIPSLTSTSITVSGTDNQGTITFYKFGKIVIMELNLSKVLLSGSWNVVGTIPNGYMPKMSDGAGAPFTFWSVQGQQGQSAQLNIKATGEIRFAYGNGDKPQLHTYVTYIVN
jgi:hypothetical protein